MQRRLYGHEQEWGMIIGPDFQSGPGRTEISPYNPEGDPYVLWLNSVYDSVIQELKKRMVYFQNNKSGTHKLWLSNGGLVYIDGRLLETATAECLIGSLDNLRQEKAVERILAEAAEALVAGREFQQLKFFRNNVGPSENSSGNFFDEVSFGSHQSYSYPQNKQPQVFHWLENFIPAALIFSGSGHIYKSANGKFQYLISPRAVHIKDERSSNTQGIQSSQLRPILNIRDEPLMSEASGLKRAHIISRDATRCELQSWLVDMTTHLVMRVAEEGGEWPYGQQLRFPCKAMTHVNQGLATDLYCLVECGFPWFSHDFRDIFDYNKMFLGFAKQLSPLSSEERLALREWERILELLKARAYDKLVGELDWVTKKFLLERKMKQYGFGFDDPRAWKIDFNYHNVSPSPNQSWFARLEEAGYIRHLISPEEIESAKAVPPQDTRAKSRGDLVLACRNNQKELGDRSALDWEKVLVDNVPYYFGEPQDPFSPESSGLRNLYKELGIQI